MTGIRTGKPNGRPPREFDKKIVEGLCSVWCTYEEIESILKCDKRSLEYWCQRTYDQSFDELYNRFADTGKASLRRNQLHLSKKNAAMCIWLGKQKLGQRDLPQEIEQFNGKLAVLLEKLVMIETSKEFEVKNVNKEETTNPIIGDPITSEGTDKSISCGSEQ